MAIGAVGLMGTFMAVAPVGATNSLSHSPSGHTALTSHAAKKIVRVAFKGTYSGTIALLWSSSGVEATSVSGHGTGTYGANKMSGTGGGSAASTCDPFSGTGALSGPSGLKMRIVSSPKTQACAAGSAAPTSVSVKGVATVVSGTGKFKGATGILNFKGSFSIQSTTAGSKESDSFSATLTGVLTIKK
ncbi:MAG: hypothetical protein HIU84_06520 [Acidobacteria bacterium]|nr:hypothetical protein [Acidobacteriota bacterium]